MIGAQYAMESDKYMVEMEVHLYSVLLEMDMYISHLLFLDKTGKLPISL